MATIKKTPAIRFKWFEEEWNYFFLEELVSFYNGLTYSPKNVRDKSGTLVLRSSNVKNGEIVDADNVYVNSEIVNSQNVQVGDIVVVVRNGSRSLIGKHAQVKKEMTNTVIGAFMTGIHYKYSSFINCLLDSPKFYKEIEKNLGATINQITTGAFKKMHFAFPNSTEQTQIGKYFKELDDMIRLQEQKLEKVKNLKKAMLEKMFPAANADVPEIRFKGFADKWERKTLGEVADIIGGGTPSTSNKYFWNGSIDWYSPTEIGTKVFADGSEKKITELGLEKSSATILPANRTVLFTSRAGIGDMAILRHPATTNQGFQSIVLKDGYEVYFIYSMGYLIKDYALKYSSGSTFLEISGKLLARMPFRVPSLAEQQKIGEYFQNLDQLITQSQQKIEQLKHLKQALLQKMFI